MLDSIMLIFTILKVFTLESVAFPHQSALKEVAPSFKFPTISFIKISSIDKSHAGLTSNPTIMALGLNIYSQISIIV